MDLDMDKVNSACAKAGIPFEELKFGSNLFTDGRGKPTISVWVQWKKETESFNSSEGEKIHNQMVENPGNFIPGLIKTLSSNLLQQEDSIRKRLAMIQKIKERKAGSSYDPNKAKENAKHLSKRLFDKILPDYDQMLHNHLDGLARRHNYPPKVFPEQDLIVDEYLRELAKRNDDETKED